MKALFIIHCQDPIYGASRSVGNLIRNLDADVDIIFPVKIKNDGITAEQIAKYYGPRVKNVWFLPQPERLDILKGRISRKGKIKSAVKEVLYLLCKSKYKRIFREGNYDFIHLNSVTLFPILSKKWPMFIHVRDTFANKDSRKSKAAQKKMNVARGIIFIDFACKELAPDVLSPAIVLINPFDQTCVKEVDREKAQKRFGIKEEQTVYAIAGNVSPFKGVDKAIEAFQQADLPHSVFLVVGSLTENNADPAFVGKIRQMAQQDSRIHLTDEVEEIEQIYRITDYVVRCDPMPALGRTVYEALYSGCGVILQNDGTFTRELPNTTEEMQKKIFFYQVRDKKSMIEAYRQTNANPVQQRTYVSNVSDYVADFLTFVQNNS